MSIYFRTNLSQSAIFLSISLLFSVQAIGFNVDIDGVLNDVAYKKVSPLNSAEKIGVLYLVPMKDELYIGAEVEDAKIYVDDPQQFWQGSGIEIWFDWGNEGNATFDKNDQQFWFVPIKGKGKEGYAGQWHRAQDNIKATIYDYANEGDLVDMAFVVDKGKGYTIEARIAKEAMAGYTPNGTIGFTYSVDKGGAKFQWDKKNCANGFWENPSMWPDLELSEVLSVEASNKLPIRWGSLKLGL